MTKQKMIKAVFNWSGGKDSALALWKSMQCGDYEIVALLTTVNSESRRSTMHGIPLALLQQQADSIGIPLYILDLTPKGNMEDYATAMRKAVEHFQSKGVSHFIFGDIFLHDVRAYRESQLAPYGITVVEPLWNKTSDEMMEEFLSSGIQTVIVTTTVGMLGSEYIGRSIDRALVDSFPDGIDVCGENGEYHTFCYDGPLFTKPVPYELGEPFMQHFPIRLEDGTEQTYSYWFANLNEKQ